MYAKRARQDEFPGPVPEVAPAVFQRVAHATSAIASPAQTSRMSVFVTSARIRVAWRLTLCLFWGCTAAGSPAATLWFTPLRNRGQDRANSTFEARAKPIHAARLTGQKRSIIAAARLQPGPERGKENHEAIDLPRCNGVCLLGRDARSGDAGGRQERRSATSFCTRRAPRPPRHEPQSRSRRPGSASEHAGRRRNGRVGQPRFPRRGDLLGRDQGRRTNRVIGTAPARQPKFSVELMRELREATKAREQAQPRQQRPHGGSREEPLAPLQWDMKMIHATADGSYAEQPGGKACSSGSSTPASTARTRTSPRTSTRR